MASTGTTAVPAATTAPTGTASAPATTTTAATPTTTMTIPASAPATTTTTTTTSTTTTTVPATIPEILETFDTETVSVGDHQWFVAVADTPDRRFQGLRRVADLGALDGMIFVWDAPLEGSFIMRTVPVPLDIGFFDAAGVLFEVVNMFPCGDSDDCPLYRAGGPYQFAIERPAGGWDDIEFGAVLVRAGS